MLRSGARSVWLPLGLLLTTLIVSGCESLQPRSVDALPIPVTGWPERRTWLQQHDQFSVVGRVAVAAGSQGFSGSLRFSQQGARSELSIDGPLGVGGMRMNWDGEHVDVLTSRGERLDGPVALAEIERRLGFVLPLEYLRYWLLGVPAPETAAEETLGEDARLTAMLQNDWTLVYTSYAASPPLPQKFTAQRAGARVRVVVDRWLP